MEGIMEQPFWANGPKPGSFYDFHAGHSSKTTAVMPVKHTQYVLDMVFFREMHCLTEKRARQLNESAFPPIYRSHYLQKNIIIIEA